MNKITIFVFFLFSFLISFSQDNIKKPKIGLVLSGGGAKGFAHIGALKIIEKAGVKIDYIAGTSMGAIIGGLYASGYGANQIDSIFKSVNFNRLIQDFIPRSSKNFYEKRNDELYALALPFNKFKINIPESFSKGLYNYNLLSSITRNTRYIKDFNKLKIPFLCIATDIETGEQKLLDKGNLALAMTASAAFPSLFSPVKIDNKILVDGGVVNNYPIDEIKKMGADIVIGVDVQESLLTRDKLKEATKILSQISILQSIEKMKLKIAKTDIYIKPNIKDYSVISFDSGLEIIQKGEEAALEVLDKLKKYGDVDNFHPNSVFITADSIHLNKIIVNELKNYNSFYVKEKLPFKENQKIGYDDLKKGIENLDATQNFSSISYELVQNNNKEDLVLSLIENQNNTFLKFSFHYDELFKSGVMLNISHKKSLYKNDFLSFDLILGDNLRYNFDYFIDNGFNWSIGLKSQFNQFKKSASQLLINTGLNNYINKIINIRYYDITNQIYFQRSFAKKFLIGVGGELKFLKISAELLPAESTNVEQSNYSSIFGFMKFDSYDKKYFPRKGVNFDGQIQSYLYSSDYTNTFLPFSIVKSELGFAFPLSKKIVFELQADFGLSFGGTNVPFLDFALGGFGFNSINNFKPFYGYDFLSIAGNSFFKTLLSIDYEIIKKHHLNFSSNFANIGNDLYRSLDWLSITKYSGYAIGYGLETMFGPIQIKYSFSPQNNDKYIWFSVGYWF